MEHPVSLLIFAPDLVSGLALEVTLEQLDAHIVQANAAQGSWVDIVCGDPCLALVVMRNQAEALDLASRIRTHSSTIPILFVVEAGCASFPAEEAYGLGNVDHIVQPVSANVLNAKVSMLLHMVKSSEAAHRLERERQHAAETGRDRPSPEFLATLAHELRNPLAPIRSGLGVIQLSKGNPEVVEKIREMMERQVSHLVRLIDDLQDVARVTGKRLDLKKASVSLNDIIQDAVGASTPAIEAAGHVFTVNLPSAPLTLNADRAKIALALQHVLINAARYTPAGGSIRLAACHDHGHAVISVTDNGVGISEEKLPSLYEMFNQASRTGMRAQGGLGIGLPLIHRLIQLHEGSVTASSAGTGMGTTFTIRLPLAEQANAGSSAQPAPSPSAIRPVSRRFKLLVVDDNLDAADSLSDLLELDGHTIRAAYSGSEALRIAQEFQPEVAILDLDMPGMNGYETARSLRAQPGFEGLVLVALTGWGTEKSRDQAKKAGFDHHLTKPVELASVDLLLSELGRLTESTAQS
ncbi:signal transduction histidine kinase [Paucimonas lemoignei]|uniref:histidine kinase n=1 Tax=Paucimonas lemoignei TaxID=29443 RepID=A0A4R3I057_PAULE|nr:response regulator [Paucimonas lemoignei]TCS38021.1 signal transduction histidine kinase [Paucimonas lemoignei]